MSPDYVDMALKVVVILASAGGVYGAIRSDLAAIRTKAEAAAATAQEAHQRIDRILMRHLGD